jgi:hypothetical protein
MYTELNPRSGALQVLFLDFRHDLCTQTGPHSAGDIYTYVRHPSISRNKKKENEGFDFAVVAFIASPILLCKPQLSSEGDAHTSLCLRANAALLHLSLSLPQLI